MSMHMYHASDQKYGYIYYVTARYICLLYKKKGEDGWLAQTLCSSRTDRPELGGANGCP